MSPENKLLTKALDTQDSIIKEGQLEKYEAAVHSRPPEKKKDLRYSKFNDYEKEIIENYELANNDIFERINITSNVVRQIFIPS